jgi:hypothetical protein
MRVVRLTVTVDEELVARLKAHCKALREPVADMVSDAIALHLDELQGPVSECEVDRLLDNDVVENLDHFEPRSVAP